MNNLGIGSQANAEREALAGQRKLHSLLEVLAGTVIGFILAFGAQHVLFIAYDVPVSHGVNAWIVSWMTLLSVVRSYILRRVGNWWTIRRSKR